MEGKEAKSQQGPASRTNMRLHQRGSEEQWNENAVRDAVGAFRVGMAVPFAFRGSPNSNIESRDY